MSTANTIVDGALKLIGATSLIKPARPEVINQTFEILVAWLNELASKEINITGLVIPTVIGDNLTEPADSTTFLMYGLAVRTAPFIQKICPQEVKTFYKGQFQTIYNLYGPVPKEKRKDTLPLGIGNDQPYWNDRNFYPEGYDKAE